MFPQLHRGFKEMKKLRLLKSGNTDFQETVSITAAASFCPRPDTRHVISLFIPPSVGLVRPCTPPVSVATQSLRAIHLHRGNFIMSVTGTQRTRKRSSYFTARPKACVHFGRQTKPGCYEEAQSFRRGLQARTPGWEDFSCLLIRIPVHFGVEQGNAIAN